MVPIIVNFESDITLTLALDNNYDRLITRMQVTVDVKLRAEPKKRSIKLQAVDNSFHMMLIWDKSKPESFKTLYQEMADELSLLLKENGNKVYFAPMKACENSTYGRVDSWLTDFVLRMRAKYTWIYTEKDLPYLIDDERLFAHFSRREIKEGSFLNLLKEPNGDTVCLNVIN